MRDFGGASEKASGWSIEFWFLMTHTSFFNGSVIDLVVPESIVGKNKITYTNFIAFLFQFSK